MDTTSFFDFVFVGVLSMRFHPKNTAIDMSIESVCAEVEFARRVAIEAVMARGATLDEVSKWRGLAD